jgi:alkylhydroperoxidase/carboxymuconolactone decarboxylase family protein YurZ
MSTEPTPPARYQEFLERYPHLGDAWGLIAEAGTVGPIDSRTARLIKLGVAIGALRQGAVRASARKGLAQGLSAAELEQVVALAAGTIGLPATVAAFSWVREVLEREAKTPSIRREHRAARDHETAPELQR